MIIGRNRPGGPATQAIEGSNNVTTFSDEELRELLQAYIDGGGNIANVRFDNKGEAHAIHAYVVTGELYSPEAEAVFANMPTTPTDPQKQAIAAFVDSLVAADIWAKIDHFNFMGSGLSWPENNALTDWIAGRTAIKNGTPTLGLDGYEFNGVDQSIDSSYNPSTDATAYQLNDAMAGAFLTAVNKTGGANNPNLFDATGGSNRAQLNTLYNFDPTQVQITLNDQDDTNVVTGREPQGGELWAIQRSSPLQKTIRIDGIASAVANVNSVAVPNGSFLIATNNTLGNFLNGKLTNFLAGGSLSDAQHQTLYNSLIQLLIDFDVFAGPVLARFPSLTGAEQTAVRNFVNTEVKNGNFFLWDEFYCFAFTNSADCLTGFKSKTAVNNGAVFDGTGAVFAGAESINSNFSPSEQSSKDNTLAGVFSRVTNTVDAKALFGVEDVTANTRYRFYNLNNWRVNSQTGGNVNDSDNESLYIIQRTSEGSSQYYKNGVQVESTTGDLAGAQSVSNFEIGNVQGGSAFITGTISTFIAGAAIGFDHPGHNVAVRQLLTELGAI